MAVGRLAFGQSGYRIEGVTQDSLGNPLFGTSVKLFSNQDTLSTSTNEQGHFIFTAVKSRNVTLKVSIIGFKSVQKSYHFADAQPATKVPTIQLAENFNELDVVEISAENPVSVKEDTIQYDASAFPVREGDAVDEMVKKLPGVEVDQDGKISTGGQAITKVRLNGKDYFGDDAAKALQNLPADIVQNIQIIDDYGEQAKVTGLKTGESQKVININTKPDKRKGYFMRAGAGLGTSDRYSGRFRANRFTNDRQFSLDGSANNTAARSAGLTDSKSLDANYSDKWGDKLQAYGSYKFNNNVNRQTQRTVTQNVYQDYTRIDDDSNTGYNNQSQHYLFWNLEYKPDTSNYLKVSPRLNYNYGNTDNQGYTASQLLSTSSTRNSRSFEDSHAGSFGTDFFFNHRFAKRRRNLSIFGTATYGFNNSDNEVVNNYTYLDSLDDVSYENQHQFRYNRNKNTNLRVHFSYMEPIGEYDMLEANYQWSQNHTDNTRTVNDLDSLSGDLVRNPQLSNAFKYDFITNRIGLTWRSEHEKYKYNLGLTAQPVALDGTDVSRENSTSKKSFNWIPNARFVYMFAKEHTLTARYRGSSNQPSFTQLQPITDNSNLQNVVTGNPDLKPEYSSNMQLEYKQSDWKSGFILFSTVNFSQTKDKIVTKREIIPDSLKQLTTYINTDGFYTANGYYSVSIPFSERKYVFTYYGSTNYSRNIAFTNDERNIGNNVVFRQGLKFRLDIDDHVDTEINTNYSINRTTYSSSTFDDRQTNRLFVGLRGRNYFFEDWTLGYDFSQTINNGYNATNTNPTILNVYLERRFLKQNKAAVRLEAFDLLNENTGIGRDVFDNVIVDSQSNRLARYFILTLNYRLQQFGS